MTSPQTLTMEEIRTELTDKEIAEIDFRAYANVIRDAAKTLVFKVNHELIIPIAEWMDDPDFIATIDIEESPNWAEYKKKQREMTKQQKMLAAERLRLYHETIKRRKALRKDIAPLKTNLTNTSSVSLDSGIEMAALIGMFSPSYIHKIEIARQFKQLLTVNITTLLPWKTLLRADLKEETSFSALPAYHQDKRLDTISKFQHLLQMDTDGEIRLEQSSPQEDITIIPEATPEPAVRIIDRTGTHAELDWSELSDAQRSKVIADAVNHKIICKSA